LRRAPTKREDPVVTIKKQPLNTQLQSVAFLPPRQRDLLGRGAYIVRDRLQKRRKPAQKPGHDSEPRNY